MLFYVIAVLRINCGQYTLVTQEGSQVRHQFLNGVRRIRKVKRHKNDMWASMSHSVRKPTQCEMVVLPVQHTRDITSRDVFSKFIYRFTHINIEPSKTDLSRH